MKKILGLIGIGLFIIFSVIICSGCAWMIPAEKASAANIFEAKKCLDYYNLTESENLFKVYSSYELNRDILTNRKGTIIVEKVIGRCIDEKTGAGVILGKEDEYYNYISYKGVKNVGKNDIVCSYLIYNPDNNYEDDIIERYDFIIDKAMQNPSVTVDRIEDNNYVVLETVFNGNIYISDVKQEDFNIPKREGEHIPVEAVDGEFYGGSFRVMRSDGKFETWYQFKSYDNSVWWALTEEEIGHIPEENSTYTLIYYDNGTNQENHTCPEEYECDCYCYDDILVSVIKR